MSSFTPLPGLDTLGVVNGFGDAKHDDASFRPTQNPVPSSPFPSILAQTLISTAFFAFYRRRTREQELCPLPTSANCFSSRVPHSALLSPFLPPALRPPLPPPHASQSSVQSASRELVIAEERLQLVSRAPFGKEGVSSSAPKAGVIVVLAARPG